MFAIVHPDGTLKEMIQGDSEIDPSEAEAIFRLHKRGKLINELLAVEVFVIAQTFYYFSIIMNWNNSMLDYAAAAWIGMELPSIIMCK